MRRLIYGFRKVGSLCLAAVRRLSGKRVAAAVAALLLWLGVSCLPASQTLPPKDEGERFGEIHWYQKESSP
ncbi:MAG: hypothetical protein IJX72_02865 [Clostridia bacterium]|nr:hypothetical protein [Clostridia bacterium]